MTVDTAAMVAQWREAIARGGHRAYSIPVVEMVALLDALDVLTTALQWYADEKNWDYVEWDWEARVLVGKVDNDVGKRARAALATVSAEGDRHDG